MTTYNGSRYVIEQLESIRTQTLMVDEVIICDDKSTDDTVAIVRDYIDHYKLTSWSVVVNIDNLGFADNFMQAIKKCTGDLIFLSDQDDIWYEDKVEVLSSFMAENTKVNCVASSYQTCDSVGKPIDIPIRYNRKSNDCRVEPIKVTYFSEGLAVRGASMCFRSWILDEQLNYRIGRFGHDTIISLYSIVKGGMVFYNRVLFKYRIHDANVSSANSVKEAKFANKTVLKRVKILHDDISVVSRFIQHKAVVGVGERLFKRRLNFSKTRLNVISTISLFKVLRLVPYLGDYIKASRHGFAGGCYTLLTDVVFGFKYKKTQGKHE